MKKVRMNISHFRFILYNLKIFGEIVTTWLNKHCSNFLVQIISLFHNYPNNVKDLIDIFCLQVYDYHRLTKKATELLINCFENHFLFQEKKEFTLIISRRSKIFAMYSQA